MKRLFVPLAVALAFAALLASPTSRAEACSYPPDYDFNAKHDETAGSEVIVVGRITGWDVAETYVDPFATAKSEMFVPIRVSMNVDRVLKGDAGAQVEFIDLSLQGPNYSGQSAGRGWGHITDCGPAGFQFDPTNYYAILGLRHPQLPDSRTAGDLHRYRMFFVGSDPKGPSYDGALALVDKPDFPWMPVVAASILGPLAFLVVSSFFWRRPKAV